MNYDLRELTVMITGASRGLGEALAEAFASAGARLSLCARKEPSFERLEVHGIGHGRVLTAAVDVRDERQVEEWIARTTGELGPPHVLINNASVLGPRLPLVEVPPDEWREALEVNLTGAFLTSRAVLGPMLAAGRGCIINISSGAAIPPRRGWGAYAISKSAMETFSRNLAAEVEGTGVRVNIVDPGAMRTDMRAEAYPDEDPATLKEPSAIAPLLLWLASEDAVGVTGKRFQADEWLRRGGKG